MNFALRFQRHAEFHQAALWSLVAAPLIGLTIRTFSQAPETLAASVAAGVMIASTASKVGWRGAALMIVASGIGVLGYLATSGSQYAPLVLAFPMLAVAYHGLRGMRLWLAAHMGMAALCLGQLAGVRLITSKFVISWPLWLTTIAASVIIAASTLFVLVPKHICWIRDFVSSARKRLAGVKMDEEMAELVDKGHELWTEVKHTLSEQDANREILEEAVLRLSETARRWSEAAAHCDPQSMSALTNRMESLDKRIESADDPVVIEQYRLARGAVVEQAKYLRDIESGRARVLARMHSYVAAMERLRLAIVRLESTNATHNSIDLAPMLSTLQELGSDMDAFEYTLRA